MPLSGNLDLDGDGNADIKGGYVFDEHYNDLVTYGNDGETQTADAASAWKASKGADNNFPASEDGKILFETSDSAPTKVTITIWLEGWHQLSPQADPSTVKAMWDPSSTVAANINVGLTFDVGRDAFNN